MLDPQAELCKDSVFNSFYKEHSDSLYRFMYYRCGNKDRSLDLVQEAFLKIWNKCSEVTFEKAKSYLFSAANNLFLNEVRHDKVVLEYMDKLQKAIANLTDGQREVFLLSRMEDKKYSEIAEMLAISVKAVEKRMMGALNALREEFQYFRK